MEALIVARHGPASRSAALSRIAARSSKDSARQPGAAAAAASIASADVLLGRVAHGAEHMPVVVRRDDVDGLPAAEPLPAADGHGQLGPLPGQLLDLAFQGRAVSAPRWVLPDRLVDWRRHCGDGVHDGLRGHIPASLADTPCLHAAATAPTAAATVSTRAQSCSAAAGDPVAAARLAYKVASSAMPNEPDSRSAMLNSVLASGIALAGRAGLPSSSAMTSGWTVRPRAAPRPQSSAVVTQSGVAAVEQQQPQRAGGEQREAPGHAGGDHRGPRLPALDQHAAQPARQAHDHPLGQQHQAGDRGAVLLDLLQEHRGEEQHGEQHHAGDAGQRQGDGPRRGAEQAQADRGGRPPAPWPAALVHHVAGRQSEPAGHARSRASGQPAEGGPLARAVGGQAEARREQQQAGHVKPGGTVAADEQARGTIASRRDGPLRGPHTGQGEQARPAG